MRLYSAVALVLLAEPGVQLSAETFALFRSMDRGRTWTRADAGLSGRARINALGRLGRTVFAGTDAGIFVSSDTGSSWRPAGGGAAAGARVLSLTASERSVFAGTERDGLLVSSDGGRSWARSSGFPGRFVRSLVAHGGRVYAGTDAQGVYVTSDDGGSWRALTEGLPAGGQIFSMAEWRGRIFAGLYAKGLYVWEEMGQRWVRVGRVSPLALAATGEALLAGHNPGGISRSADGGGAWSQGRAAAGGDFAEGAPVWEMGSDGERAYAGAAAGIYFTEDHGRTWVRARAGLPAESPGIAFLATREFVLASTTLRAGR